MNQYHVIQQGLLGVGEAAYIVIEVDERKADGTILFKPVSPPMTRDVALGQARAWNDRGRD
jgi:hypothetical protein